MKFFEPLLAVDLYLLDHVAQPVVDWLSERLGVHFIRAAQVCVSIACGVLVYHVIDTGLAATFLGKFFTILSCAVWLTLLYVASREARVSIARMSMNRCRYSLFLTRLLLLVLFLFDIVGPPFTPWLDIYAGLIVCGYYILSCNEGPPQRKKVRLPFGAVSEGA